MIQALTARVYAYATCRDIELLAITDLFIRLTPDV
jgi:hypothetical protein